MIFILSHAGFRVPPPPKPAPGFAEFVNGLFAKIDALEPSDAAFWAALHDVRRDAEACKRLLAWASGVEDVAPPTPTRVDARAIHRRAIDALNGLQGEEKAAALQLRELRERLARFEPPPLTRPQGA